MNNRIRELRKALGITQKEFAEKIGLRQNAISNMEKEKYPITTQNLKSICSQFHVNEAWLRTGEGEMFVEDNERKREYFAMFDSFEPAYQDYLLKSAKALLEMQETMRTRKEEGRD